MSASVSCQTGPTRRDKFAALREDGRYVPLIFADEASHIIGIQPVLDEATVKARGYKILQGVIRMPTSSYMAAPGPMPPSPTVQDTNIASPLPSSPCMSTSSAISSPRPRAPRQYDEKAVVVHNTTKEHDRSQSGMMESRYAPSQSETSSPTAECSKPAVSTKAVALRPMKTHCHYYFHNDGECGYSQVGCKFSHDFPDNWEEIYAKTGLNHIPEFFRLTRPGDYAILLEKLKGWDHPPWSQNANREMLPGARPSAPARLSNGRFSQAMIRYGPHDHQREIRDPQLRSLNHRNGFRSRGQHTSENSHRYYDTTDDSLIELESAAGYTSEEGQRRIGSNERFVEHFSSANTTSPVGRGRKSSVGLHGSKYSSHGPAYDDPSDLSTTTRHPRSFLNKVTLEQSSHVAAVEAKNAAMYQAIKKSGGGNRMLGPPSPRQSRARGTGRSGLGARNLRPMSSAQRVQRQVEAHKVSNDRAKPPGLNINIPTLLDNADTPGNSDVPKIALPAANEAVDASHRQERKKWQKVKSRRATSMATSPSSSKPGGTSNFGGNSSSGAAGSKQETQEHVGNSIDVKLSDIKLNNARLQGAKAVVVTGSKPTPNLAVSPGSSRNAPGKP